MTPAHCWVAAWLLQNAFAEARTRQPSRPLEAGKVPTLHAQERPVVLNDHARLQF